MTTSYPGAIDAFNNPDNSAGDDLDTPGVLHDEQHANANDAIEAIETELGTNPSGASATVKARIEAGETATAAAQATADAALPKAGGTMTGDLILAGDPEVDLEAVTKQYVDAASATAQATTLVNSYHLLSQAMTWYDARAGSLIDLTGHLTAGDTVVDNVNAHNEPNFLPFTGSPYLFLPGWDDMWLDTPLVMPTDGFILKVDHTDLWPGASGTAIPYAIAHQGDETDFTFALFRDASSGDLELVYSYDGTTIEVVNCPAPLDAGTGRAGVGVKLDAAAGSVTFYQVDATNRDLFLGPISSWDELGIVAITPGSLHQSSFTFSLSGFEEYDGPPMAAKGAYGRLLLSELDGTQLLDFDPAIVELPLTDWVVQGGYPPVGPTTTAKESDFLGGCDETWTIHVYETHSRPPVFVNRAAVVTGNEGNITFPDDHSYDLDDSDYDLNADITIVQVAMAYHTDEQFSILSHAPGVAELGWSLLNDGSQLAFVLSDGVLAYGSAAPVMGIGEPSIIVAQVDRATDEATVWVNGETTLGPGDISAMGDISNSLDLVVSGYDPDNAETYNKNSFVWYATLFFNRLLTEEERTVILPYELGFPYLAEHALPAGGTIGQVLAKASNEDFDTEWATVSSSGGGGTFEGPITRTGHYSFPLGDISLSGTFSLANDCAVYAPFPVAETRTFDRIGLLMHWTGPQANTVVRLGIYDNDDGYPGNLIVDAGTVDTSTTGLKEITISEELTPGLYWLCAAHQGAGTGTVVVVGHDSSTSPIPVPSTDYLGFNCGAWKDAAGPSGALPATASFGSVDIYFQVPRLLLRGA